MKNGLASNYCYDAVQDQSGRIWVATLNGLSRFNGTYWQNYQQQSVTKKHRIPANWVMDLSIDQMGRIYANTDRGFCMIDDALDSVITFETSKAGWGKICTDKTNRLFVSSWNGIDHYQLTGSSITALKSLEGTSGNSITQLFCDQKNTIWACPEDQPSLISYAVSTGKLIYNKQLLYNQQPVVVHAMCELDEDWLILCTKNQGLLRYSRKSQQVAAIDAGAYNTFSFLCAAVYTVNKKQFIVAGTAEAGLVIIDQESQQVYNCRADLNNPQSICSNQINMITPDNDGGMWLSTSQGLSYFHPSLQQNKLLFFYNIAGYPDRAQVNAAAFVSRDTLLVGTDQNGLFYCTNELRVMHPVDLGNRDSISIRSIVAFDQHTWWVATSAGLYRVSRNQLNKGVPINTFPELSASLLAVRLLNDTLAGVCTHRGAVVWNYRTNKIILNEPVDSPASITKDILLHKGAIWILRFFNGPEKYDLITRQKVIATPTAMIGVSIDYHSLISNGNDVWVSTTFGLLQYVDGNPKRSRLYTSKDGLDGDVTEQVVDGLKNEEFIYNTRTGLYAYNASGKRNTLLIQYENYNQKWYNQLSITADSFILCTVGDHLLMSRYPQARIQHHYPFSILTEYISVNDQLKKEDGKTISLRHNENNIAFQFALPVYPEASKQYFRYRLTPGDSSWKVSRDGQIRFFNLAPNTYTLVIEAYTGSGELAGLKQYIITIRMPFYKTLWFYLLLILAVALGVILVLYYQQRQREQISAIRNQISRDLHDELGANVSSIHIMARMLAQQGGTEKARPMLDKISAYSVQVSNTINDIIWNVNPKFDSVAELFQKMTRYASESLEAAGLNYTIEQPEHIHPIPLNSRLKYNFFLIFKEAVNNAAKYSAASQVSIYLECNSRTLHFELKDDGVGITELQRNNGNGLGNMAARASEINASFSIDTSPGKGTHIQLTVKY